MTDPSSASPSVQVEPEPLTVVFSAGEAKVVRAALRAYEFESAQYVRTTNFEPCAPECAHCAPRVKHFADLREDLQRRLDLTVAARKIMDAASGPSAGSSANNDAQEV